MNNQKILDKLDIAPFSPPSYLAHELTQTIVPYYIPNFEPKRKGKLHQVLLPDGDRLVVTELCPPEWKEGDRIIVLIHGLAGNEDSPYIKRLGEKFFRKGLLVVKLNLRSCGPGRGLAINPYHSGRSEDTRVVLRWLQTQHPRSPITQLGFSLSANITLKMAGEGLGKDITQLDSCIAVSPPLDLMGSAYKITQLSYGVFDKFFLYQVKNNVRELQQDFPGKIEVSFPRKMNLMDFDDLYTAPRSGFSSGQDYYEKSSSKHFVPTIKTPTLILHSMDDPVVASECLQDLEVPSCIDVVETEKGGHVGFLDNNGFWMDQVLVNWVMQLS